MVKDVCDSGVFNELADSYHNNKKDAVVSLLLAGKILCEAKSKLSFGQFGEWLGDRRVGESLRTAQRMMSVFNNFGHLLADRENKLGSIENLPLTFLLELEKLPDRFKKDVEIIRVDEGGEHRELRKVVDEDKLSDLLETVVESKDGMKALRDLPVSELRKYIREVQGIVEPTEYFDENKDDGEVEAPSTFVKSDVVVKQDVIASVVDKLCLLSSLSFECFNLLKQIDESVLFEADENLKETLKQRVKEFRDKSQALYVGLNGIEERL